MRCARCVTCFHTSPVHRETPLDAGEVALLVFHRDDELGAEEVVGEERFACSDREGREQRQQATQAAGNSLNFGCMNRTLARRAGEFKPALLQQFSPLCPREFA